jgi:LmbE family N-acetylglucosaminyl deacetylase
MSHPYHAFARDFVDCLTRARALPLGGFPEAPRPALPADAPRTLVFSPHPDDESIIGALPLRLRREAGHRVVVVAVTQGSKADRQAERLDEMRGACGFLGFDLVTTRENGLGGITPKARQADPAAWEAAVAIAAGIIQEHRPAVIVVPHDQDAHPTHQGSCLLVMDALRRLGPAAACHLVLTEYWSPQAEPNLMVESTPAEVGDLMAAISFHRGEVVRNPYHVLLPSWMSDNVRRGSELVGVHGGAAVDFAYATLYRALRWDGHDFDPAPEGRRSLPAGTSPATLFP